MYGLDRTGNESFTVMLSSVLNKTKCRDDVTKRDTSEGMG